METNEQPKTSFSVEATGYAGKQAAGNATEVQLPVAEEQVAIADRLGYSEFVD